MIDGVDSEILMSSTELSTLPRTCRNWPHPARYPAIVFPQEKRSPHLPELDDLSDRIARGLGRIGIGRGVRTVLLVPPGPEFFALTFALFKFGAVPVLIDPGIGIKNLKQCLR